MLLVSLTPLLLLPVAAAAPPIECARYGEVPVTTTAATKLQWDPDQGFATLGPLADAAAAEQHLQMLAPSLVWRLQRRGNLLDVEPSQRSAEVWLKGGPRQARLCMCLLRHLQTKTTAFAHALVALPASLAQLPDGAMAEFADSVNDPELARALRRERARESASRARAILAQGDQAPAHAEARHVVAWFEASSAPWRSVELREALNQAPTSPLRARTAYLLARTELQRGHDTIAREIVEPELTRAPEGCRLLLQALLAQVPGAATVELEHRAATPGTAGAMALAWLGVARWRQGDPSEGAALLRRAEQRDPGLGTSAGLALLIAEAHRLGGNHAEAHKRLSRIVQQQRPQCFVAAGRISDIHALHGDRDAARRSLGQCRDVLPWQASWLQVRTRELEDLGSRQETEFVYHAALREPRLAELRPELVLRQAVAHYQARRESLALALLRGVPQAPAPLRQIMTRAALRRAAEDRQWVRLLRLHAHAHPDDVGPDEQRQAAQACAALGLWQREIEIRIRLLREIGAQAPVTDLQAIAEAYRQQGDLARQRMTLRFLAERGARLDESRRASPEDAERCAALPTYGRARCLLEQGDLEGALSLLDAHDPEDIAMRRALAARARAIPGGVGEPERPSRRVAPAPGEVHP